MFGLVLKNAIQPEGKRPLRQSMNYVDRVEAYHRMKHIRPHVFLSQERNLDSRNY